MEMLRETFFVQGLIVSVIAAVLVKLIVWRNYHKLLASSEEMDRLLMHIKKARHFQNRK